MAAEGFVLYALKSFFKVSCKLKVKILVMNGCNLNHLV